MNGALQDLKQRIERHYAERLSRRAGAEVDPGKPMVRLSTEQTARELGIPPADPEPFIHDAAMGVGVGP